MNINAASGNSYVNAPSSNRGFHGLASGLDTDSIVESMLAGTQAKIDKQNGLKQQIEWKQEIYRDIISQLNTFQSQFFDPYAANSLKNPSFFNAMVAGGSFKAFSATATSSAATGNTSIEVRRLASKTTLTSGSAVSGKLNLNISESALNELVNKELGDSASYTAKFKVGEKEISVDLRDVFVENNNFKTYSSESARDLAIEEKLNKALSSEGVAARVKDGKLELSSKDKVNITVSAESGSNALKKLGLTANQSSSVSSAGASVLGGTIDDSHTFDFKVNLDGFEKDVKLDMRSFVKDGKVNLDKFAEQMQEKINKAHGNGQISVLKTQNGFELSVSSGRKVMIMGNAAELEALGVKNGQSNRIGLNGSLKDLYFSEPLQGSSFKFSINGVKFSFDENATMGEVMDAVNRSSAGVRMVYNAQSDKFTLEASESGAGRSITMTQEEGNLLTAIFGGGADGSLTTGNTIGSKKLSVNSIGAKSPLTDDEFKIGEGVLHLNINGKDLDISIPKKKEGTYTKKEVIDELNKGLKEKLGSDAVSFKEDGSISVTDGSIVTVKSDYTGDLNDTELVKKAALAGDLGLAVFGQKEASNKVTGDTTLKDLGIKINGKDGAALAESTKLSDLEKLTGGVLKFEDGAIRASKNGAEGGDISKVLTDKATIKELFKVDELKFETSSKNAAVYNEGQNAIVSINGLVTERASNNFEVNGLNISLKETTGQLKKAYVKLDASGKPELDSSGNQIIEFPPQGTYIDENGDLIDEKTKTQVLDSNGQPIHYPRWEYVGTRGERISQDGYILDAKGQKGEKADPSMYTFTGSAEKVEVSRDTDKIVEGVKQFVDAYNKIVKTLRDYMDEDADYKKYPPLTEAQKKEMSEKEIKLWEEKAKKGLIRKDSTIENFLQSMRVAMYEKPAGSSIAIYDLGIETGDWESQGQLVFSKDGEAKLRKMIESNPDEVMKLFTDPVDGLATKLNDILDKTAKVSSGSPGALVTLAGVKGKASEKSNTLNDRLKEVENKISNLKRSYEKEKNRYWKQFNAMEQLIANMSAQSSWLTQQMGQF